MSGISNIAAFNPINLTMSVSGKTTASASYTPPPATKALQDLVLSRFMDVSKSINETLSSLNPSSLSSGSIDSLFAPGNTGGYDMLSSNQEAVPALLDINQITSSAPSLASSISYLLTITNNNSSAVQSYLKKMFLPDDIFGSSGRKQSFASDVNSILQPSGSLIDEFL